MNTKPDYATVSLDELFAWVPGQEGRYELVEGEVVMMAGAGRRHDAIVVNLIAAIRPQTRGGPCQTLHGRHLRRDEGFDQADAGYGCRLRQARRKFADGRQAVVGVEVLAPTTGGFDLTVKLAEYQSLPSLDYILFVDTESPTVHLYRRADHGLWQDVVLKGLDAVVEPEKLKITVPLRDIYEGLQFRPKPKLVQLPPENDGPNGGFRPT
jgi:Uma2 family endonuclease